MLMYDLFIYLSSHTATPPRKDYVQVFLVLQKNSLLNDMKVL